MAFDTTDYQQQRFFPASVEDKLVGVIGRVSGIAVLLVTAFVWLSLVSWTTRDPSLTLAVSGPVQNWGGAPGAVIADLLLQMLGFASVVALLAPMFWGVELITARQVMGFRSKVAFFPLSVLVLAGALSAMPTAASWPIEHGYGGILGDFVFGLIVELFAVINPARAGAATGLLLAAIGASTLVHSIGLELRDLRRILFQPIRRVNWREKAGSWQHTLLSEAKRLRGGVRDNLDNEWQEHNNPPNRSVERTDMEPAVVETDEFNVGRTATHQVTQTAVVTDQPEIIVAETQTSRGPSLPHSPAQPFVHAQQQQGTGSAPQLQTEQSQPQSPQFQRSAWLRPLPANPMVPRAPSMAPAQRVAVSQPVQSAAQQQSIVPALAPHPVSNPFEGQQSGAMPVPNAQPTQAQTQTAPMNDAQNIAQKFAAFAANGAGFVEETEAETEDVDEASREIARRFAPASARVERANTGVETPHKEPVPEPQPGLTMGRAMPPLMRSRSSAVPKQRYVLPSTKLLARPQLPQASADLSPDVLRERAETLQSVLADFGVNGAVKNIRPGPVVTLYEFEPARGTKSSRVIGLADDIARSMSAISARVAVVPGRNVIGIELPNAERRPVLLRELLDANAYRGAQDALPLTLGKSIGGEPIIADLARMPHLLVAGTTGSGKSVGVNAMVLSILFKHAPETCRLLMIDPKMLELSVYNDIPHLLSPVITDPQKAVVALNWAVREMEERYKRMSKLSVRNIGVYNNRVRNAKKRGERLSRTVHTGFDASGQATYEQQNMDLQELPHIVIVVDEFADLMLVAGKEIEAAIQRLAQMARAAGIHLIMATQRPSVDVITGTIKANFPTRISFKVTSKVDSRTILNEQGAEQLLGQGDMLYASGSGQTVRVHGPFVSDEEVEAIANYLKAQSAPKYVAEVTEEPPQTAAGNAGSGQSPDSNTLYDQAVALVLRDRKASTSYVQRRLSIGYNRAADLIERMEQEGVIGPAGSGGKREILVPPRPPSGAEDAA